MLSPNLCEKYRKNINIIIIHKKINWNDHYIVPRLNEIEIGLGQKIGGSFVCVWMQVKCECYAMLCVWMQVKCVSNWFS